MNRFKNYDDIYSIPTPTPIETSPTGYEWLNVDNELIGFYSIRRINPVHSNPLNNNRVCAVFTGKNGAVGIYYWTRDEYHSWTLDEMFDCGYGDPSLIELISVCPDRLEAIVDGIELSFEAAPAAPWIQYMGMENIGNLITNECEGNPYCPGGSTDYDTIDTITVAWIQDGSLWIIPTPEPAVGKEWLSYSGIWSQVAPNRYLLHGEGHNLPKVPKWYVEIYPDEENPLQQYITRLVSLRSREFTSDCCYISYDEE